jgi:hypothetical protein
VLLFTCTASNPNGLSGARRSPARRSCRGITEDQPQCGKERGVAKSRPSLRPGGVVARLLGRKRESPRRWR